MIIDLSTVENTEGISRKVAWCSEHEHFSLWWLKCSENLATISEDNAGPDFLLTPFAFWCQDACFSILYQEILEPQHDLEQVILKKNSRINKMRLRLLDYLKNWRKTCAILKEMIFNLIEALHNGVLRSKIHVTTTIHSGKKVGKNPFSKSKML